MTPAYSKLTPRRRLFFGSAQLWRGDGHILLVTRLAWTERYQRFRFADIESIVITRLGRRILPAILVLLALVPSALAFPGNNWGWRAFASTPLLVTLIAFAVDLARGPRCRVRLNTAVSSTNLAALGRLHRAEQFLAAIEPEIRAAQGSAEAPPVSSAEPRPQPAIAAPPRKLLPVDILAFSSSLLLGAFGVALLYGLNSFDAVNVAFMLALGGASLAIMVAATSRYRRTIRAIATVLALAVLLDIGATGVAIVQEITAAVREKRPRLERLPILPWYQRYARIQTGLYFAFGLTGLAASLLQRRANSDTDS